MQILGTMIAGAICDGRLPVVCVVDPDPACRDSLCALLQTLGVAVRIYESGEALLANLNGVWPLCIIAEIRLPNLSGLELLAHLQNRSEATPLILLSSEPDVSLAVKAMREGALDFIEKPHIDPFVLQDVERLMADQAS